MIYDEVTLGQQGVLVPVTTQDVSVSQAFLRRVFHGVWNPEYNEQITQKWYDEWWMTSV